VCTFSNNKIVISFSIDCTAHTLNRYMFSLVRDKLIFTYLIKKFQVIVLDKLNKNFIEPFKSTFIPSGHEHEHFSNVILRT
jgi:hypothetical protein